MAKEETKEEVKKEAKSTKPAAKKPAAKPKKEAPRAKGALEKAGYVDIYDYITLAVGLWGLIWTLIGFILYFPDYVNTISQVQPTNILFNTIYYNYQAAFFTYMLQFYIYITLTLFPFVIKGIGVKVLNKWPDTFPLHFIKTAEDLRGFMVFVSWWSCLFFWIGAHWMRWPHMISVIALLIPIFAEALHKKISKMPRKKIKE